MWKPRAISGAFVPLLLLHSLLIALVSAQGSQWKTLSGKPPLVVAHGGFSGIFPDSSKLAYDLAVITSTPDVTLWCDVQLTKDGVGICLPDINLDNSTEISFFFTNGTKTYLVNGEPITGYFSVDYTFEEISNVTLKQGVFSRSPLFDGNYLIILRPEDVVKPPVEGVVKAVTPPTRSLWLNIQHDAFYSQHNLSMRSYVISVSRSLHVSYISSPEAGFLRSIATRFSPNITKLVYRFLDQADTDPSSNQTYASMLKNLTFIKTFASGIMVPKGYIWPVDDKLYLQPHTSLVSDAHKVGLEVFASDFTNDIPFSFNYSYDPIAEYLQFTDNGDFSVDGVLSDFPITPSEAVDCFAHLGTNATRIDKTLIISKYGASGDYPACTDLAYQKAIFDGVDVLDCPVQMSKDGIPFCLNSIDLLESTNVAQSDFNKLAMTIPEVKSNGTGIFTFNLMWNDIKGLRPSILNPYSKFRLFRNPLYKSAGNFVTLSDFLSMTKNETSLSGVLIIVEHAAYLANKQGLSVTDAVIDSLKKAGYDKPGTQKVYIQSTNSSVLQKFKEETKYDLVYRIDETVGDAANAAVDDIKSFATSVVINKNSVFPQHARFLTGSTNTLPKLLASNLSVFVETFSNEFTSQAWDFFSDATVEINSYIAAGINGVITDFPKTANRYTKNRCLNLGNDTPPYMQAVRPGSLYELVSAMPPAEAPLPPLTEDEVVEPPLPPVAELAPAPSPDGTESPHKNAQPKVTVCFFLSSVVVLVASLLL